MQISEAVRSMVTGLVTLVLGATAVHAECDCVPYVKYILPDNGFELSDVPWEIVSMEEAYDMTDPDEPLRCFVQLDVVEWDFAGKYADAPLGQFALHDGMQWHFSDTFEADRENLGCSNQFLY